MLLLKAGPKPFALLSAPYEPFIYCASHLRHSLDPGDLSETIRLTIRLLSEYDFDAIAFQGLSGAMVAPIVAMMMGKTLLAVRKPGESCHSMNVVEGDYNARRYVILDDFISSGTTARRIHDTLNKEVPRAVCIGMCEYIDPSHLIPAWQFA